MIFRRNVFTAPALVAVLAIFLLPASTLAQPGKTELVINLAPGSYSRDLKPEESATLFLEVRNVGYRPMTNIRFRSDSPQDWSVKFAPDTIDTLPAGSSRAVDVTITAARGSRRGDYTVTLMAEANETRSVTSAFLRVQTVTTFWLWIGAAIAGLVIAGFVFVYLRYGRR